MIISKTPLRVSFTGGGSDIADYYKQDPRRPGAVISTSIDKSVFVNINRKFDDGVRLAYSKNEEVPSADDIEHPIVRAILHYLGIKGGLEITTIADIPSKGSGLGSSSAFSVGLLQGLYAYLGVYAPHERLAREACMIEIEKLGEPIGKQDQYASTYGGFNYIEFHSDESVIIEPILTRPHKLQELNQNCLFFYTGQTRSASEILAVQKKSVQSNTDKYDMLTKMVELTRILRHELNNNRIDEFGALLHENWLLKKSLADSISNPFIDEYYQKALSAGAEGGKILGAGAGGFFMFYAHPKYHNAITDAMLPLRRVQFGFTNQASQIIFTL